MNAAKELKLDIIEMLFETENIPVLEQVRDQLQSVHQKSKLNPLQAAIEIQSAPPLESIMQAQNYQPITFRAYQEKVENIEWEHSIDELLALLD
ncbi:MAG: hypothetical protein AAF806_22890 [Bacteroidota bacterium]